MTLDKLASTHIRYPGFYGYELATRTSIAGVGKDVLARLRGRLSNQDYRYIDWLLSMDVKYTGGYEANPDLNPDTMCLLKGLPMRRPGLWGNNGYPCSSAEMLGWKPGAITVFYDYLDGGLLKYKQDFPSANIIVRFNHPQNWRDDITKSAVDKGREVASKWPNLKLFDPYVYVGNEINLHYENGDNDPGRQTMYETKEHYQKWGEWVRICSDTIKTIAPEMKLVCPPFASGHREDLNNDGDWIGYDFLHETITKYLGNTICHHDYWGHAGGCVDNWLYGATDSPWYAYRWKWVVSLFKTRYKKDISVIIDEAGNMQASHPNFTQQIIDHSTKCLQDSRVIAVTYFLWNDPTNNPGNVMNSWAQRAQNLSGHLQRLRDMPDVVITSPVVTPAPVVEQPPVVKPPVVEPPVQAGPVTITPDGLKVDVTYPTGLNLIIANWLNKNAVVKLTGPMGGKRQTLTNSKLEFAQQPGQGGFELYCETKGIYTLEIDGYIIKVDFDGRCMKLIFSQTSPVTPPVTPPVEEPKTWAVIPKTGMMTKTNAEKMFATLQANELTKNLFEIKEMK